MYKDSVELAKRSQKLLCSPVVDLRHLFGGSTKRRSMAPAAGLPRMLKRRQVRRNRLLSMSGQHRRDAQRRTATSMPKTALPPFLWRRSARCRSRSISCVRSARPWRCSFGRRGRDQRANGWAPFQSSVPCDFLSALRPARAVPAHRRRGDGADKNEATVRLRYHEDAIHEQADRWSRTAVAGRRRWSSAHADGPWCGSTYNCGFYSFEQCYETVRGAGGGPRTSVTAGRQDGA